MEGHVSFIGSLKHQTDPLCKGQMLLSDKSDAMHEKI